MTFGHDLARCAVVYDLCHEHWTGEERTRFHNYVNKTIDAQYDIADWVAGEDTGTYLDVAGDCTRAYSPTKLPWTRDGLEFTEEHKPALNYERFHYPDPRVQLKMYPRWERGDFGAEERSCRRYAKSVPLPMTTKAQDSLPTTAPVSQVASDSCVSRSGASQFRPPSAEVKTNKDAGPCRASSVIVGNVIQGYINGVEVISATDNTYDAGSPGMGFNFGGAESNGDVGFSHYQANSDND